MGNYLTLADKTKSNILKDNNETYINNDLSKYEEYKCNSLNEFDILNLLISSGMRSLDCMYKISVSEDVEIIYVKMLDDDKRVSKYIILRESTNCYSSELLYEKPKVYMSGGDVIITYMDVNIRVRRGDMLLSVRKLRNRLNSIVSRL